MNDALKDKDGEEVAAGAGAAAKAAAKTPAIIPDATAVADVTAIADEPVIAENRPSLAPVQAADEKKHQGRWTRWLVWFLRGMAVLSMAKGLYHWSLVLGIGEGPDTTFTTQTLPWQTATVYFAIIDLVAAVGLWLAAVWGAVVWLTAGVSMAAVEVFFPQIYGGSWLIVAIELFLLCCYLVLALQSAREHPH